MMNQNETPIARENLDRIRALLAEAYPLAGASAELEDEIGSLLRRIESGYYDCPATLPSEEDLLCEPFKITSVARQDLIDAGFPLEQALSADGMAMEQLAREMCDDYCNQLFWNHLRTLAEPIIVQAVDKDGEKKGEGDTRR
jgi:hypothetical protein